jgi:hypothetical protein
MPEYKSTELQYNKNKSALNLWITNRNNKRRQEQRKAIAEKRRREKSGASGATESTATQPSIAVSAPIVDCNIPVQQAPPVSQEEPVQEAVHPAVVAPQAGQTVSQVTFFNECYS